MKRPIAPLDLFWLTEAIRLREEQGGPLEDSEASRQAIAQGGDLQQRILTRAYWLARREQSLDALKAWHQAARLALLAMLLLSLITGTALAFAALGDGQHPVNIVWALVSLLGLNLLTLLGWLGGLTMGGETASTLGRAWLWLSNTLSGQARSAHLAPALMILLGRQRLTRWLLGMLVNGLWTLAMLTALAVLLALLSTRRYGFIWETTILDTQTFVLFTQLLGSLPALLHFPLPDSELIRASGDVALTAAAARHSWAGWLLGVTVVYGLLPRLSLWLFCSWRWQRGRRRLRLDLQDPGYSLLAERLQPASERLGVSDAAPQHLPEPAPQPPTMSHEGAVLTAIELDDRHCWPPALPPSVHDGGILDDGRQRRLLLQQLTQQPPARLAVAIDPHRSPDRGTLALLSELSHCAAACRIWLLSSDDDPVTPQRLETWQTALDRLQLPYAIESPLSWLETGHD